MRRSRRTEEDINENTVHLAAATKVNNCEMQAQAACVYH